MRSHRNRLKLERKRCYEANALGCTISRRLGVASSQPARLRRPRPSLTSSIVVGFLHTTTRPRRLSSTFAESIQSQKLVSPSLGPTVCASALPGKHHRGFLSLVSGFDSRSSSKYRNIVIIDLLDGNYRKVSLV